MCRLQRRRGGKPAQPGGQHPGHGVGSHDRPQYGLLDSATVTQEDDIRCEDVDQTLQDPRFRRLPERLERVSALSRGIDPARPARGDVRPRPVSDLADRGRALADRLGDLVVPEVEHVTQDEHRPLGRREGLQHQHHRHRDAVGQRDVLGHIGRGEQRLGQPGADVRLSAPADRAQPDERLAGGDPDQVRTLVLHGVEVDAGPAQPGLLQDVLRVDGRAEHLVGDRGQQVAVGEKRLGGRVRAGHGWLPLRFDGVTHRTPGTAVL